MSDVDRHESPDPDEGGESACWMHLLDEVEQRRPTGGDRGGGPADQPDMG